tara:strand:- start:237 stop:713 length:477 start_codon:yes stop_codon:yes gene_type:complete
MMIASLRTLNKAHLEKSNMIRSLVPCPTDWLPEETAHLARRKLGEKPRRVWFPEDSNGEPHDSNPDDGCGGAKFKLTTIREFPKFVPNEVEKKSKNSSGNAYRWLADQIRSANLTRNDQKMRVWGEFDEMMQKITNPEYDYIGLAWRSLFGKSRRIEE